MDCLNLLDSFRIARDPAIGNYLDVPAATVEGGQYYEKRNLQGGRRQTGRSA